jgi:hypothetical protein
MRGQRINIQKVISAEGYREWKESVASQKQQRETPDEDVKHDVHISDPELESRHPTLRPA